MSQATAVFSALKAYDANLGQRQADWLENPQIQKIPFHLVDESFLRQQSLADVLQGSRAIDRLLSIASPGESKIFSLSANFSIKLFLTKAIYRVNHWMTYARQKVFLLSKKCALLK